MHATAVWSSRCCAIAGDPSFWPAGPCPTARHGLRTLRPWMWRTSLASEPRCCGSSSGRSRCEAFGRTHRGRSRDRLQCRATQARPRRPDWRGPLMTGSSPVIAELARARRLNARGLRQRVSAAVCAGARCNGDLVADSDGRAAVGACGCGSHRLGRRDVPRGWVGCGAAPYILER